MAASELKKPRLLKTFSMPVDPAAFAGIPSVTALKPLPRANVLLAAAMDRRLVCCDLSAELPKEKEGQKAAALAGRHLAWSHDNWIHALDVHPVGLTSLNVLDAFDGKELLKQPGRGFGVAFHPGNRWLAFSQEQDIVLWDFQEKKECQRISANQLGLFNIFFLDEGDRLAAGGCNGQVGIWDLVG